MLIYKDSDRESVISYFELGSNILKKPIIEKAVNENLIDTPKRLVNYSNEFLI